MVKNPFDSTFNDENMSKLLNNNNSSKSRTKNKPRHANNKSSKSKLEHKSIRQRNSNNKKKSTSSKNKVIAGSVDSGYTNSDIKAMDSKYSTDRLNLHILNILKRFQHMTGDSSRSKLLYRLTKIAYPKIMNTTSKRKEYKQSGKLAITNLKFSHKI